MKPRQTILLTVSHTERGPNVTKSEETWSGKGPQKKPCISHLVTQQDTSTNLKPFDEYIRGLGRNRQTGQRWRKAGLIEAINIYGRWYISSEEIARFEARAKAGEFAK